MGVCPLSLLCGDDYVLWKCADYSLYVWQLEMGVGGGGIGGIPYACIGHLTSIT